MSDLIYLDHAATTAVHPDVLKEMLHILQINSEIRPVFMDLRQIIKIN